MYNIYIVQRYSDQCSFAPSCIDIQHLFSLLVTSLIYKKIYFLLILYTHKIFGSRGYSTKYKHAR